MSNAIWSNNPLNCKSIDKYEQDMYLNPKGWELAEEEYSTYEEEEIEDD